MTGPLRPAFFEGQVLAAADLAATVGYSRGVAARHERYLHDWGIAEGLAFVTENRTDPDTGARYVEVSVSPGLAIDGTGREIVVPAPVLLSEAEFLQVNDGDGPQAAPYPVFLTAVDRARSTTSPVSCGTNTGPTRVEESYQILFGRLGDERLVNDQPLPPIGAAPADPPTRWLVLLGYVLFANGHFVNTLSTVGTIGPRHAGVRADTVAARSDQLSLRTQTEVQEGKPALVLSGEDPPSLVFGLYQGSGAVSPLMTVAANGNLTIAGSFSGQTSTGSVVVTNGTATDGMLLPLPDGVSPQEVADGRVLVYIHATPVIPPSDSDLFLPSEVTVDSQRRVRCRMRSYDPTVAQPVVTESPGAVDYLVLATIPATNGGG